MIYGRNGDVDNDGDEDDIHDSRCSNGTETKRTQLDEIKMFSVKLVRDDGANGGAKRRVKRTDEQTDRETKTELNELGTTNKEKYNLEQSALDCIYRDCGTRGPEVYFCVNHVK